ncbi:alpha-rhamnosidase [uncultured Limosilactobacillus sp.]|uniref:alpha-L-rhamnosidase-related protein n=1 Tax=uncultured Limosilactobacillus sp. TaxID=2837629 RepID=UPI0025FBBBE6|nr:alpha-rhamnosidase [uncultured Limosilactobacillus sp.]
MAFTFQINNEVEFNHNQTLLKKAKALTPTVYQTKVSPIALVKPVNDEHKLNSTGIKKIDNIENLPKHLMKRDDHVILDFGNHYVGYFKINIHHVGSPQDAPLTLKLKFAEVPAELVYNSADYDGWLSKSWIQEETIHLDHLPAELKLPRRYAFRYVDLKIIDTSPKWSVSFDQAELTAVSSAHSISLPKLVDSQLQSIYNVSVKTLQDCMQTVFEDGPKRDRRLWLGDLRLQALANYATFNNNDLVKRCLYLFAGMTAKDGRIPANVFTNGEPQPDDTFLLDYGLFFISTLHDYVVKTHDISTLQELYPIAKQQVHVALQSIQNGLYQFNDHYPVFVDWSNDFDKTTAGQAIIIYTFKQFVVLAQQLNKSKDADYINNVIKQLSQSAMQDLFDSQKQLFISGPDKEINIASQVWMVLAKVVTGSQATTIMQTAKQKLFPITGIATPYMYHHITEAFFCAGLNNDGIELLKSYWGKMIQLGADTYWEAFEPESPNYSPYGSPIVSSYCLAWGCTPAYLIKKYLVN